jgi:hypothetical protein
VVDGAEEVGCELCTTGTHVLTSDKLYCDPVDDYSRNCKAGELDRTTPTGFAVACQECADGHIMLRDSGDTFNQCLALASREIDNCQTYATKTGENALQVAKCLECDPAYELDGDNGCELIEVANCETMGSNGEGCLSCESGYLLSHDNLLCILDDAFPNCLIVDSGLNKCHKCQEDHYQFKDGNKVSCTQVNPINQCLTPNHDNNRSNAFNQCSVCQPNYYLTNNKRECKEGKVAHCQIFQENQPDFCQKCLDNYLLVNLNQRNTCVNMSDHISCKNPSVSYRVDAVKGLITSVDCSQNQCPEGETLTPIVTERQDRCSNIDLILNCKEYSYAQLKLTCALCDASYWYNSSENRCVLNTTIENCAEYSTTSQACVKCADGYLIDQDDDNLCLANPSGTISCQSYDSQGSTCVACKPNSYLSNGLCVVTDIIPNCKHYSAADRCTECESSAFQLVNTQKTLAGDVVVQNYCFEITLDGCQTEIVDQSSCQDCFDNYKMVTENNKNVCKLNTTLNENCQTYNGANCVKCSATYYMDTDNTCKKGDTISDCLEWDGKDTCLRCEAGTTRSVDKKSCFNSGLDSQCVDLWQ